MTYFNLRAERDETSSLSVLIRAGVGDNAIEPRRKVRVFAKLIYGREQFQKDLLRDITRHRLITAVVKRDGVDPILVGLKQVAKGFAIALLASLDHLSLCLAIAHYRELLHKPGHPSFRS